MFGLGLSRLGAAVRALGGGGGAFSPADLFLNGEQGAWYDPSDLTTMFQDSEGATPVTADGQPVGKILDKSGRGNHASQATSAARPLYKTDGTYHWLQFDGVDDSLITGNINFTSTDKMSVFAGAAKLQDAAFRVMCEGIGNSNTVPGSFTVGLPLNGNDTYLICIGSQPSGNNFSGPVGAAKAVFAGRYDLRGTDNSQVTKLNLNAVPKVGANAANPTAGTGNFANGPLRVGARVAGQEPFNGNIYSLIVRGALSTADEITDTETWVNSKTGAF